MMQLGLLHIRITPIIMFHTYVASFYAWISANIIILTTAYITIPITTPTTVKPHSFTLKTIATASILAYLPNLPLTKCS
jgi:hypothetical protein